MSLYELIFHQTCRFWLKHTHTHMRTPKYPLTADAAASINNKKINYRKDQYNLHSEKNNLQQGRLAL